MDLGPDALKLFQDIGRRHQATTPDHQSPPLPSPYSAHSIAARQVVMGLVSVAERKFVNCANSFTLEVK